MQSKHKECLVFRVSFTNAQGPEETDGEATHPGPRHCRRGFRSEAARTRRALHNETNVVLREARIAVEKAQLLYGHHFVEPEQSCPTERDATFTEALDARDRAKRRRVDNNEQQKVHAEQCESSKVSSTGIKKKH